MMHFLLRLRRFCTLLVLSSFTLLIACSEQTKENTGQNIGVSTQGDAGGQSDLNNMEQPSPAHYSVPFYAFFLWTNLWTMLYKRSSGK